MLVGAIRDYLRERGFVVERHNYDRMGVRTGLAVLFRPSRSFIRPTISVGLMMIMMMMMTMTTFVAVVMMMMMMMTTFFAMLMMMLMMVMMMGTGGNFPNILLHPWMTMVVLMATQGLREQRVFCLKCSNSHLPLLFRGCFSCSSTITSQ